MAATAAKPCRTSMSTCLADARSAGRRDERIFDFRFWILEPAPEFESQRVAASAPGKKEARLTARLKSKTGNHFRYFASQAWTSL
jgi:hypothetical protein